MKVTRDVIYDLLPGYFSGDISPDTRALVEEFLDQDPEFRRMMERFRTMFQEPRQGVQVITGEKATFERARAFMNKRGELRGFTLAFGFAAIVIALFALFRLSVIGVRPIWLLVLAFLAVAFYARYQLFIMKRQDKPL